MVTKLTALLVAITNAQSSIKFQSDVRRTLVHEDEGFIDELLVHEDEYGDWVHSEEMQYMIHGRRDLQVVYTTQDSFRCRQCIEENNIFCLNSQHDKGTCCRTAASCS